MRAVIINQFGDQNVLEIASLPTPALGKNELLIRVQCAALNPKDVFVRKGKMRLLTGARFPLRLGSDLSGVVEAVGKGVSGYAVGDAVFGMINSQQGGAYAEQMVMKVNEIAHMPKTVTFAEAAGVPLAALTSLQALRDLGKLQAGQRVCINGASGGVGVFAIQIAKTLGAQTTAVSSHRNLDLLQRLGADTVIDYTQSDVRKTEQRFDVFYDVFGNRPFPQVRHLLKPSGIHISTIPSPTNLLRMLATLFSSRKAKLVAVRSKTADLQTLAQLIDAGKVRSVIDSIYPLAEVAAAHAKIETKRARGKIILQIGDQP